MDIAHIRHKFPRRLLSSRSSCRFSRRDNGFTLTELVIAMVVLGVLTSIAIPSFLGSRNNAYDKEAQASIEVMLRAAKFLYQSQGDFSDGASAQCGDSAVLAADLQKLEPNVDVVASTVSSTNSRVVSVQAVQTWSSNAELLGCQGFYAVALSSSGSCWAARLITEGKFLASGSVSPVVVNTQTHTSNNAITTWSALAVNGNAFGVLRPQTSAADGDNTNGLTAIKTACKAKTQSTGLATTSSNYISPSQFYSSWRDTTSGGTANSSSSSSSSGSSSATYALGETGPGGGVVFYISAANFTSVGSDCNTTCRYLEVRLSGGSWGRWSTTVAFCYAAGSESGTSDCQLNSIYPNSAGQAASRTLSNAIGMGMTNTNAIYARVTAASGIANTADYAAGVMWSYSNNGKEDWYLASKDELNQMCKWQRNVTGTLDATVCTGGTNNTGPGASGFSNMGYWSSSEETASAASRQYFLDGTQGSNNKGTVHASTGAANPVRAFG